MVALEERKNILPILKSKQFLYVVSICIILMSSLVIVDIVRAGHEYEIPAPSLTQNFPHTVVFYNISEGVSADIFSLIAEVPVKHSNHHHIVPREINLIFWFRDVTDGTDLSPLINEVYENLCNGTFSIRIHSYDKVNLNESGIWAPSLIHLVFNDHLFTDTLRFGIQLELTLINYIDENYSGHELDVQLEMRVTYSRYWFGQQIAPSHQIVTYNFNLTENGFAKIQKLQYYMPWNCSVG